MAGLASIAKIIYEVISDVNEGKKIKKLSESQQDLIRVTDKEFDMFMSLSDVTYSNFESFRKIVCDNFKLNLNREARLTSENIISQHISSMENEIFHIFANRVPDTYDFIRDFTEFCIDINSDPDFCKKLSFSSLVDFTNPKLILENESNALILRTRVRMPILAEDFPSKTLALFRTLNIGFFDENNNLAKIQLPKFVIKTESIVYGMTETCQNGICFMNALTRNSKSICAQSTFSGSLDNCQLEISSENKICDFTQVPGLGTIVTASNGRYSEVSDDLISVSKIINNATVFFENDGQLECLRESGPSFHRLITHKAAKFSLRVPEVVNLKMNLSEMTILDNNQNKYFEIVNDLKTFHQNEYYQLGKYEISDDSAICYAVISVIILLLIILFGLFGRTRRILMKIPNSVLKNLK